MSVDSSEGKVRLIQCKWCGKRYVPPRYVCANCNKTDFSEALANGEGEVYSFTIIRMPFEEFAKEAPYAFGEIKLNEGIVVPGRFTNEKEKEVKIGSKVSFLTWERGVNWFQLI
jgi:scaffold protein (connect acetoacetyl-CoA thiolase and HMG-CoA synthase)